MGGAEWLSYLTGPMSPLWDRARAHLPELCVAAGLVLAGWCVAWAIGAVASRIARRLFGSIASGTGADAQQGRADGAAPMIGRVVFWTVFFFFLTAATETMGYPVVSGWLGNLVKYLPSVLAAVFIVFVGMLAGDIARGAIRRATANVGTDIGQTLGAVSKHTIVAAAVLVAVTQIGIDVKFLVIIAAILVGSICGGLSLAFALGSKTAVANLIAAHYVLKSYRAGQRVKIGSAEGRILEIGPVTVIVENDAGRISIPAKQFLEDASILLNAGG